MNEKSLLPYLYCYWQVADCRSFTRAAEKLHISQSAVSYQIRLLETRLGLTLLDRDKRSAVRLTPAGQQLADHCQNMFPGLQKTVDAMQGRVLSGDFTIAAPTCFGSLVLSEVLVQLRGEYPEMRPHIRLSDQHIDLRAEQVDMAFRTVSSASGFYSQPLLKIPTCMVASPDYLDRMGIPENLYQLHRHNMLLSNPHDSDWHSLRELIPEVPLLDENVTYIDNAWGMLQALKTGLGLGYMPLYSVHDCLKNGSLVEVMSDILGETHLILHLATPHRIEDSPKVKAALSVLKILLSREPEEKIFSWLD